MVIDPVDLPDNDPRVQPWVPVVSSSGKALMPCSPKRARELLTKSRAVKKWSKGTLFYIQLLDREDGGTQAISLGIDPGSKREGYCLISYRRILLNIQSHAVDGHSIKKKMKDRADLRRIRRYRDTPCREPRFLNRKRKSWVPPSTKARWQLKLNIVKWLGKFYPISHVAIEDVCAKMIKGGKKWNKSFSPVQAGKQWLASRLDEMFQHVLQVPGYETYERRVASGLKKFSDKLSNDWHAHCVDAFVLASMWFSKKSKFDYTHLYVKHKQVLLLKPRKVYRRQLHRTTFQKGHVRPVYGGTMSSGYKRGTTVTHPKHGVCILGPTANVGVTLYSNDLTSKRLTQKARLSDLQIHVHSPWILAYP